ncbi:response regulator [Cerasicoccus maritimus]|uniref:response regulator n=1 Tax=Cerasicoccus maritimus TaxID=490089 RepID=UPI0028528996|nr:response regulator [Cerasicoccus maritimus]
MAKVLVIEDVQTEILILTKILQSMGHTVMTAGDGESGLELAEREQPSLVLSDIVMPKMDGFQVCRRIKRNPTTKEIPVVLISSKTQDSDKFWGLKQGASDYLTKPINDDAVITTVKKLIA